MIGPIYAAPIVHCEDEKATALIKPIRIFQLVLESLLFTLTWRTVFGGNNPFGTFEAAMILDMMVIFLLVTIVDIVSQCGKDPIPDTPMFLFGILATISFSLIAVDMFLVTLKDNTTGIWRLFIGILFSSACAILRLLDIILIFLYGY